MMARGVRWRGESGQAVPLVAAVIVLAGVLTIALGSMAGDVIDAARAQTAADAAALASIEGGQRAAAQFAARHGGDLVAWSRRNEVITVAVRVGDVVRDARATGGPVDGPPG